MRKRVDFSFWIVYNYSFEDRKMPKAKFREGRYGKGVARTYKYKLGNRKSSTSAHTVSTPELIKMYESGNTPKDKPKIEKVLLLRGVRLGESALTEEVPATE